MQIMTPQQFVAKSSEGEEEEVSEGFDPEQRARLDALIDEYSLSVDPEAYYNDYDDFRDSDAVLDDIRAEFGDRVASQVDAGGEKMHYPRKHHTTGYDPMDWKKPVDRITKAGKMYKQDSDYRKNNLKARLQHTGKVTEQDVAEGQEHLDRIRKLSGLAQINEADVKSAYHQAYLKHGGGGRVPSKAASEKAYAEVGKTHGPAALAQLQKLHGTYTDAARKAGNVYKDVDEATKLPAQQREFGGQEFQDYMKRIQGAPDVDKAGNVKVDKKGFEKYVSGKTKGDKFKLPYIHRSSVVEYLGPDGKTYDEDKIKQTLAIRPKALLKQNEKMKHSNGEFEQFFNVGFAALTGIALDENTNNLIVVNTCPGAGACKVDCFAMKGGKIQFKAAWQSDGRILTYLLNDPDGFFSQLSAEISQEEKEGNAGDKKFPNGWRVTVRWHDAGDFFSPEYLALAFKMAKAHPNVKFYAYTKMAAAALGEKPDNFIINWSEGAHTSQEKQVKAQDPNLEHTKNSRIVPTDLFGDLLAKDAKGNLAKGPGGQWVIVPNKLPELKQRLAKQYGLSANSVLGYDEWDQKTNGGKRETPIKYNVIIAPGEPDITANTPGVLSTLLLRH